ncbi:plasmid mobilization protein [Methylobacter svalbardensis]|uniref:plasmid mobilization protein n=1 Tax=Methylobacter svalbardensis TaxID=3080016 RepID=UPI0030ED9A70
MANKIRRNNQFTKSDNPRDKFIKFYVDQDELDEIKHKIALLGVISKISISEYCRKNVLGKNILNNEHANCIYALYGLGAKLGGLKNELFNYSKNGTHYSNETAKVFVDISVTLAVITKFVENIKISDMNSK